MAGRPKVGGNRWRVASDWLARPPQNDAEAALQGGRRGEWVAGRFAKWLMQKAKETASRGLFF